jgi:hypothetical protein
MLVGQVDFCIVGQRRELFKYLKPVFINTPVCLLEQAYSLLQRPSPRGELEGGIQRFFRPVVLLHRDEGWAEDIEALLFIVLQVVDHEGGGSLNDLCPLFEQGGLGVGLSQQ